MTDTNDLRDSLKDAPQGPLDSCTLCGAIINRSYEEAHNHFHQAFHQTAYQPLASHAPDTTVQSCKICGILVNGSYEHAHNQVHQADYEPFATASRCTAETCKLCGILINRSTKTRTAAVTGSCRSLRVGGDHPLPVGNGRLQGLLRRSGRCASRSQGKDIGHTLAQEVPQALTEAVLNVDSY
jgi:hypothetical protein